MGRHKKTSKVMNIGPTQVSKALVKCSWCENTIFERDVSGPWALGSLKNVCKARVNHARYPNQIIQIVTVSLVRIIVYTTMVGPHNPIYDQGVSVYTYKFYLIM